MDFSTLNEILTLYLGTSLELKYFKTAVMFITLPRVLGLGKADKFITLPRVLGKAGKFITLPRVLGKAHQL